jgi:hypothetical protein
MARRVDHIKLIPCPEHPSGRVHWWSRKHEAFLFCWPGKYAGIWECPATGASDTHDHSDYEVETVTADHMGADGHYQTEGEVYVCGGPLGCGITIENDDPALDRHEAMVDTQVMEALEK